MPKKEGSLACPVTPEWLLPEHWPFWLSAAVGKSMSLATSRCQTSTSAGPGSWEFVLILMWSSSKILLASVSNRLEYCNYWCLYPPVMALQFQGLELGGLWGGLFSHLQVTHLSLRITISMDDSWTACIAGAQECWPWKDTTCTSGWVTGLWKWELSHRLQNNFRMVFRKAVGKSKAKADAFRACFTQLSGVNGTHYPLSSDAQIGMKHCCLRGRGALADRTNNLYWLLLAAGSRSFISCKMKLGAL